MTLDLDPDALAGCVRLRCPDDRAVDGRKDVGAPGCLGIPTGFIGIRGATSWSRAELAGAVFLVDILRAADGKVEGEERVVPAIGGGCSVLALATVAVDNRPLPRLGVEGQASTGSGPSVTCLTFGCLTLAGLAGFAVLPAEPEAGAAPCVRPERSRRGLSAPASWAAGVAGVVVDSAQTPLVHAPLGQTVPQAPQLFGSVASRCIRDRRSSW